MCCADGQDLYDEIWRTPASLLPPFSSSRRPEILVAGTKTAHHCLKSLSSLTSLGHDLQRGRPVP
ncbi:hypothetical protein E2C01_075826 [Portunus trituberculatus]|uniref:Uncharacterized protein n=1 Tax=Portunus trituberculatus TaxID=210409 RepID=A0A5B7IHB7_PORTR|nr:hypothetical protein [Portunus trituberculatus]